MFIDLMKAINIIKRTGCMKIAEFNGRLSFLPPDPSVTAEVIQ